MIGINEISMGSLEAIRDAVLSEIAKRRESTEGTVYWCIQVSRPDVAWVVAATANHHSQKYEWHCFAHVKRQEGAAVDGTLLILGVDDTTRAILRVRRGALGTVKSAYGDIKIEGAEVVATINEALDKQAVIDEWPALAERVDSRDLPLRLALSRLGLYATPSVLGKR